MTPKLPKFKKAGSTSLKPATPAAGKAGQDPGISEQAAGRGRATPLSKKERRTLVKPRIGFESVGTRAAKLWLKYQDKIVVPGMSPANILNPIGTAEKLRPQEEKLQKDVDNAQSALAPIRDERELARAEGWKAFLRFYDHVKVARKDDAGINRDFQFMIDYMSNKVNAGSRGNGSKGGTGSNPSVG